MLLPHGSNLRYPLNAHTSHHPQNTQRITSSNWPVSPTADVNQGHWVLRGAGPGRELQLVSLRGMEHRHHGWWEVPASWGQF